MADSYSFAVTGYIGYEERVLEMRNRNRRHTCSREYLDWRYTGEPSPTPPMIFWMHDAEGGVLAMASLIFRPYSVNGERKYFGVLGDISVNEEHRGEGLSTKLFGFMNGLIEKANLPVAFVMPNQVAEKALSSSGWDTVGKLTPRVFVAAPQAKCKSILKINILAKVVCWGLRLSTRAAISRQTRPGLTFKSVNDFDADFQSFWEKFPKRDRVMHDRSLPSLTWRYRRQPHTRFSIGKFFDGNSCVGYVVATIVESNGMCLVSDFLVSDPSLVNPCMALFIRHALQDPKVVTIRVVFVEGDPYARQLWKLTFFPRDSTNVFQIYQPEDEGWKDARNWFITPGDKDA